MSAIQLLSNHREFTVSDGWINFLILLLIEALFIWFAARVVDAPGGYVAAILTALVGNFLAFIVWGAVGGTVGLVLAVLTWGLVAAVFFRTKWLKGAVIGVVAWLIWFLVNLALQAF